VIRASGRVAPVRRAALPALLLVAALVLSGCGGEGSAAGGQGYVSGDSVIQQVPTTQRRELPPITGELLDGDAYDSREDLGKVVVYNVWGSWCVPCREEAPILRRVWNETRDAGVQFVGINVKDNNAAARAFERRYKITYPSITTADSRDALLAFGPELPASAVPSTMIVDQKGRIAARIIGATTYGTLSALVEETLAEQR
jgi:thiol-disulfide isomerase/thioredoxin